MTAVLRKFGLTRMWNADDRDEVMRGNREMDDKRAEEARLRGEAVEPVCDIRNQRFRDLLLFYKENEIGLTDAATELGRSRQRAFLWYEALGIEPAEATSFRTFDHDLNRFVPVSPEKKSEELARARASAREKNWAPLQDKLMELAEATGANPTLGEFLAYLGISAATLGARLGVKKAKGRKDPNGPTYTEVFDALWASVGLVRSHRRGAAPKSSQSAHNSAYLESR